MDQEIQQEPLSSSERFETADEMVALHARMAMNGEALRPDNLELPEVKAEQLTHLDKTIAIAANGSTKERVGYWENEWQKMIAIDESLVSLDGKGKLEKEKAIWVKQMIQDFNSTVNKNSVERLKAKKIGGIDLNNFNQETANQIYQRYFADQGQGETVEVVLMTENGQEKTYISSNLNQFIDDVIEKYNKDYDLIVKDLDALEWYAGIFGSATEEERLSAALLAAEGEEVPKEVHTNEVVKELIHTRIKLENEPKKQELVEQANETKKINGQPTTRPNWLNEKEEPCLSWLEENSGLERRRIPRPTTEELEKPPPKSSWEDLKKSGRMRDAKIWENVTQIREIASNSEVIKKGLPVYYPGAGADITFALGFTDADNFVFVDFLYVNADGTVNEEYLPDKEIIEIGGEIKSVKTEGILGKGGKRIVKFEWGGKERTLIEYAEDATENPPEELKDGISFVVMKAPTQNARGEEDEGPGNIMSEENLAKIFSNLAIGGFIHWKPTWSLNPETVGFKKLVNQPPSDDRFRPHEHGWPLYQKIKHEPQMLELLNFDRELATCLYIRDGVYTLSINERTLGYFEDQLKEIKELYIKLSVEKQQEIHSTLATLLIPEVTSEEQKEKLLEYGKDYGLADPQKMQEYLDQTRAIVFNIFPELKTEEATENTPRETKSFADILQTTRQKVEAEEPIELHLDKAGLPSVIENIISAIELPIKITSPPKTDIDNQEGKVGTRLKIGAGPFQQEIDLSFNLINTADNKIVFSNIVSQPEEVFGQNVKTILEQQKLHERLLKAIQTQLNQQRANIEIESVGLQFTEDDKLALTIRGKKR